MKLSELVKHITAKMVGSDREIKALGYDSRAMKPESLFFAIRGYKTDGHNYVQKAVDNGAIAIVVDHEIPNTRVTQIVVADTRFAMGLMAASFFGFPTRKLRMIGITGTNGKTTTTYLTKALLEEAGFKVGLIGTIQNLIADKILPAKRTTPESVDLQHLLAKMVQQKVEYVVMEVSSHALELQRTVGVEFDVAIFTNLTQDHLDFHQTFDQYFNAKARLFTSLLKDTTKTPKTAVINFDDAYGLRMAARSSAPVISYGVESYAQLQANDLQIRSTGVSYRLHTPLGDEELALRLAGTFNVYNSLAAIGVGLAEGIDLTTMKVALEKVKIVPGRFELVDGGQDFTVIVDYAHTPDSLENVLRTAHGFVKNRVIVVFGAGGDRDRSKRSLMGTVAANFADHIIITSDNPRSEEPLAICQEIEAAIKDSDTTVSYDLIVNRQEAIYHSIQLARTGDVLILAGKGHETYQELKEEIINFDDKKEALAAIKELLS